LAKKHLKYVCTLNTFRPFHDERVRWLDWQADCPLVEAAWLEFGVAFSYDDWLKARHEGYTCCGIIENSILVSTAAVWTYSETAWEFAAVGTIPLYRRRGLAKAVVGFVTDHILKSGKLATCHMVATNTPMIKTVEAVGFIAIPE